MGVFTEDNIVEVNSDMNLPEYKEDALLIEDFFISSEHIKRSYSTGTSDGLHFTKGTLISFYEYRMNGTSLDKLYINLRLLKKNNQGNDSPLVGKQFQVYIKGLHNLKYKKVSRDSHLLAKTRQEKINSLFN